MNEPVTKPPRPLAVTLVSILAIVSGTYSLLGEGFLLLSSEAYHSFVEIAEVHNSKALLPLPPAFHLAHGLVGSLVWIVSGSFMLRGKNWARLLLLGWPVTALAMTFSVYRLSMPFYAKTAIYLVLFYFLVRRQSSAFFHDPSRP